MNYAVIMVSTLPNARMFVRFTNVQGEDKLAAGTVAKDHMATPHHWHVVSVSEQTWVEE